MAKIKLFDVAVTLEADDDLPWNEGVVRGRVTVRGRFKVRAYSKRTARGWVISTLKRTLETRRVRVTARLARTA